MSGTAICPEGCVLEENAGECKHGWALEVTPELIRAFSSKTCATASVKVRYSLDLRTGKISDVV